MLPRRCWPTGGGGGGGGAEGAEAWDSEEESSRVRKLFLPLRIPSRRLGIMGLWGGGAGAAAAPVDCLRGGGGGGWGGVTEAEGASLGVEMRALRAAQDVFSLPRINYKPPHLHEHIYTQSYLASASFTHSGDSVEAAVSSNCMSLGEMVGIAVM
jgi:hypothetical protein